MDRELVRVVVGGWRGGPLRGGWWGGLPEGHPPFYPPPVRSLQEDAPAQVGLSSL